MLGLVLWFQLKCQIYALFNSYFRTLLFGLKPTCLNAYSIACEHGRNSKGELSPAVGGHVLLPFAFLRLQRHLRAWQCKSRRPEHGPRHHTIRFDLLRLLFFGCLARRKAQQANPG